MKLKTKIHLFSTLLMLVVLTLTNTGIYFLFKKMVYDTEYKQILTQSEELVTSLSQTNIQNDPLLVMRAYIPPNGAVRIIDSNGGVKSVESAVEIKEFKPEIKKGEQYSIGEIGGMPVLSISIPVIWTDGNVAELQMIQLLSDAKYNLNILKIILVSELHLSR